MVETSVFETLKVKRYLWALDGRAKSSNKIFLLKKTSIFITSKPVKLDVLKAVSLTSLCFQRKPKMLSVRKEKPLLMLKKGSASGCLVLLKRKEVHELLFFFFRLFSLVDNPRRLFAPGLKFNVFFKYGAPFVDKDDKSRLFSLFKRKF
jgi:hypothetical protein